MNNTTDINPFTNLGQPGCDIGLQEDLNVLFLVGSSGSPTHQCIIPSDIKILFPLVNVVCNSLEAPPFFGQTEQAQRECSNNFIDTAFNLTLKIGGKTISNLEQYRLDSPPGGFEFEAVQGNLFLTPPGEGTGVSDGYWILLKLSPGQHQISFQGSLNATELVRQPFIFTAGATYNLDVKPAEKSYYPNDYQQNYPNDYQQNYPIY